MIHNEIIVDCFAGGGGASLGIELNPEYEPLAKARTQQMGMAL